MGLHSPSLMTSGNQVPPKLQILVRAPEPILRHGQIQGKEVGTLGSASIWLSNSDPREEPGVDVEWLNANCTFVYLDSPIVQ